MGASKMKSNKKVQLKKTSAKRKRKKVDFKYGTGIIDKIIDKLPFELHVPSYQYCGPGEYKCIISSFLNEKLFHEIMNLYSIGTNVAKRVARGDPGINPLDAACKEHDIFYTQHKDSNERSTADKKLQTEAMKRAFAKDATFGERATAIGVAAAMKIKRKVTKSGTGLPHKKLCCKKNKQMRKKNVNQLKEFHFKI